MNHLLLGSAGLLGQAMQTILPSESTVAWKRGDCDITSQDMPGRVRTVSPDVVINAAAWTDVDGAEDPQNGSALWDVNCEAVGTLAQTCAEIGARLVHVSTNEVFPGEPGFCYEESDTKNPINEYGRSKSAGEDRLFPYLERHLLIRVSWLFGPGGDHFPAKICRAADRFGKLQVVDDEFGKPTYTEDAAKAIAELIRRGATGIFHVTNEGQLSRWQWARLVLNATGRSEVPVQPIPGSEWRRPAATPRHAVLRDTRLESQGLEQLPSHEDALGRLVALGQPWARRGG